MSNYSTKQIANWRRVRMNIESDLTKLTRIEAKIEELQTEAETLRNMINMQEHPVVIATGFTTRDIFKKVVTTTDKVDANGRPLKKYTYELRYPDTIIPPAETCNNTDGIETANNNTFNQEENGQEEL